MAELFPITAGVRGDASISDCGRYRYWLSRVWDDAAPAVCWVMLNPSTADAGKDDPTVRRCMAFARRWGAGGIYVVNLFALRATDPKELRKADDPVGAGNDWAINCNVGAAVGCAERLAVVAAWGAHGGYLARGPKVLENLRGRGVKVKCLGKTAEGHPRHPLYVRGDQGLEPL